MSSWVSCLLRKEPVELLVKSLTLLKNLGSFLERCGRTFFADWSTISNATKKL